jgi:hypothetical protein
MKWLTSLILCTVLVSSSAWGQSLKLKYEGRDGLWFPQDMAAQILADVKTNKLLKLKVGELKLQLDTRLERIEAVKEAEAQSRVAEERERELKELAFTERDEALEELTKWYRHPAFLVSLGVAVTILVQMGSLKLYQVVSD